jgi:hypothetical protein
MDQLLLALAARRVELAFAARHLEAKEWCTKPPDTHRRNGIVISPKLAGETKMTTSVFQIWSRERTVPQTILATALRQDSDVE